MKKWRLCVEAVPYFHVRLNVPGLWLFVMDGMGHGPSKCIKNIWKKCLPGWQGLSWTTYATFGWWYPRLVVVTGTLVLVAVLVLGGRELKRVPGFSPGRLEWAWSKSLIHIWNDIGASSKLSTPNLEKSALLILQSFGLLFSEKQIWPNELMQECATRVFAPMNA